MDIDTLITVLFIVVIIVFQIFGTIIKKIGRGTSDQQNKKGGKKGILQSIVNQIKEQVELAQYPQSPPADGPKTRIAPGWENLMPQEDQAPTPSHTKKDIDYEDRYEADDETGYSRKQTAPSYAFSADTDQDIDDIEKIAEILRADNETDRALDNLRDSPAVPGMPPAIKPAPTSPAIPSVKKRHTARDLRQAIVWSELLAPPVALREE